MTQVECDCIAERLQGMKDLYAEYFMLLDGSIEEDPLSEQTGGLDKALEPLMHDIETGMVDLRSLVGQSRSDGQLTANLEGAYAEFVEQLRTGLQIMSDRVQRRTVELAHDREQLKERLVALRQKRHSVRGYRPYTRDRKLLDSAI